MRIVLVAIICFTSFVSLGVEANGVKLLDLLKGTVIRVSDTEFVVKGNSRDNKDEREVAYPITAVSRHARYSSQLMDELREIYKKKPLPERGDGVRRLAGPNPRDIPVGSQVVMSYGFSHLVSKNTVLEDGNYYQVEIVKLPDGIDPPLADRDRKNGEVKRE